VSEKPPEHTIHPVGTNQEYVSYLFLASHSLNVSRKTFSS
jgi:hypothetical protein